MIFVYLALIQTSIYTVRR